LSEQADGALEHRSRESVTFALRGRCLAPFKGESGLRAAGGPDAVRALPGATPILWCAIDHIGAAAMLRNGVQMPWLGLGTWHADGEELERAIASALELGYRHVDTAAGYGNERSVGLGVRRSGLGREDVFVTTKVQNRFQSHKSVLRAFEASLERLGMEYVDLCLIHWPSAKSSERWRALEQIYAEGRAKAIGVSNFLVSHLRDLLSVADVPPMVNQAEFHPRLVQPELRAFCGLHGIQFESTSPLMRGGVLEIPELRQLAATYEKTVSQLVIRWNLQHQVVVIPKSVKRERIEENSRVFDFTIAEADMRRIDDLDRGERLGGDPDSVGFVSTPALLAARARALVSRLRPR
jgi:methylglyoxal/glyoxal reductase